MQLNNGNAYVSAHVPLNGLVLHTNEEGWNLEKVKTLLLYTPYSALICVLVGHAWNPRIGSKPRRMAGLLRSFYTDKETLHPYPGPDPYTKQRIILRKSELVRLSGLSAEIYAAAWKRYTYFSKKHWYLTLNPYLYRGNPKARELKHVINELSNNVAKEYIRLVDTENHLELGGCPVLLQNSCAEYCTSALSADNGTALELITKIENLLKTFESKKYKPHHSKIEKKNKLGLLV